MAHPDLTQLVADEIIKFTGTTFFDHKSVEKWLIDSYQRVIARTIEIVDELPYEPEPRDVPGFEGMKEQLEKLTIRKEPSHEE